MKKFYKISNKIQSVIEVVLGNLSAVIMIGVTLFALAEIFRRYILGVVFQWGQDAVIYAMMCSVAFYICVTQIKRGHLVMSAFLQLPLAALIPARGGGSGYGMLCLILQTG